ncbi:unnamed protein product, partial [Mesorhabditis belari]|uniref:BtpA family membrane complex biogenesis protein n=1 Tax=Mesorhabditis belari TaxID=2138241 RepID=A0AAF3F9C3_9BILA
MIHVPALTGSPLNKYSMNKIVKIVQEEAEIYKKAKIDGLIVENMWDLPYVNKENSGPHVIAQMTMACQAVNEVLGKERATMSLGIQILAACNQEAIAVAQATGFDMIRVESFVFASVADEGWSEACAGPLLRYRKMIGADNVAIFTDIKKKHSAHAITSDITVGGMAQAAEFFLADGVIVTGEATGSAAEPRDVTEVKEKSRLPVLVGSGITKENVNLYKNCDALIVGSYFKENGQWKNKLDANRVNQFMNFVNTLKR